MTKNAPTPSTAPMPSTAPVHTTAPVHATAAATKIRQCKICKKQIYGRSDKIFCSAHCKNYYHKHLRHAAKKAAIEINEFLKRNYCILLEQLGKNKTQIKIYRNVLAKKKFRFKYHTHRYINSRNKIFHYIYDLAWMDFSDDEVLIVRKRQDRKAMKKF